MKKKQIELTAESIGKALGEGATSLTGIWKSLGGSGSVPGSTAAKMRALVPSIDSILAANKQVECAAKDIAIPKAVGKKAAKLAPVVSSAPARHPANPYRAGSAYGVVFDCMAKPDVLKDGISRQKLVEMAAKATGKDAKRSGFDVTVVCSPKETTPTCERHRSAREGYGIEKNNAWVRLVLPPSKS